MSKTYIRELGIKLPDEIRIFPYAEGDLPTYENERGDKVTIDKRWREVGYAYKYPTASRIATIRNLIQSIEIQDSGVRIRRGGVEELARYLASSVITKILFRNASEEIEETRIDNDAGMRGWLADEIVKCEFLLLGSYLPYLARGGEQLNADEAEEEAFLSPSENTSHSSGRVQPSDYGERREPTQPISSAGE